jgi:hypothetical protein
MTVLSHLGHRGAIGLHAVPRASLPSAEERLVDRRVFAVQRLGAGLVGLFLLLFGLVGAISQVPLLTTDGERILGLSANGLLAALSMMVGAVLIGAALEGPRLASAVMLVLGPLFLLSALVNLAVLGTSLNLLAFRVGNVVFSLVVGWLLLVLGAYGRLTGNLPADSPYAHPRTAVEEPRDLPSTPAEIAAERAMRAAEIAVVEHRASDEQIRRVAAMAGLRTRDERRRAWMELDQRGR